MKDSGRRRSPNDSCLKNRRSTTGTKLDTTTTATTVAATTVLPLYVYFWSSNIDNYSNYFTLMVDMRYVPRFCRPKLIQQNLCAAQR